MTISPNNPFGISLPAGSAQTVETGGRGGELLTAEIRGKYAVGAYYNRVFSFNRTAVTIPAIAATLVSVFSLYNPPTSSANAELIDIDVGLVLATEVVDTLGLYWQGPTLASLATLTTIGVMGTNWFSGLLGGNAGQVTPYSALTHSGTPVRVDIASQFSAVTSTSNAPINKAYDGKVLLAPGGVLSAAMSTAAGTASGIDISMRWLETNTI